jgi:hypothetical protein
MQAAACIKASSITAQEYRSQLYDYKELAINHGSNSSRGRIQDSGVKDPVAAALLLSIDKISCDNVFAADCLFFAACVD